MLTVGIDRYSLGVSLLVMRRLLICIFELGHSTILNLVVILTRPRLYYRQKIEPFIRIIKLLEPFSEH